MPLSEHERRLLSEIETALSAENPHLAGRLRTARLHSLRGRLCSVAVQRWRRVTQLLVGLLLLVLGVQAGSSVGVPLGVAGFVAVVLAVHEAVVARRHRRARTHR